MLSATRGIAAANDHPDFFGVRREGKPRPVRQSCGADERTK